MGKKLGNGGYSQENYDEETGRYEKVGSGNGSQKPPRGQLQNPAWEKLESYKDEHFGEYLGDKSPEEREAIISKAQEAYNQEALGMIIDETGYDLPQAMKFQNAMIEYLGGDFESFTAGERQEETRIIDEGLARMPKFDGTIFRGMRWYVSDKEEMNDFVKFCKDMSEKAKSGKLIELKGPQSWTSDSDVAKIKFAEKGMIGVSSVVLGIKKNKNGVGVQHISHFGDDEAEVMMPSTSKFKVLMYKEMWTMAGGEKYINIVLEEV